MNKKILIISISVLLTGALFTINIPFSNSLQPNAASTNQRPHIDISQLEDGDIVNYYRPAQHLVIQKFADINPPFLAITLPMRNKQYLLPEFNWSRAVLPCQSFVQEYGYQCLDKIADEYVWYHYMKWNKAGKYIGEQKWGNHIPDIPHAKYKLQGNHIALLVR
ncbi:hypothetical protein L0668_10620 [Paraglaciecola aquimarina]|uniref:Uncharacterized protein n=1 Tax=Paraglaciecola algarum TaxID=3050085 RepID=A0ABS9D6Q8_9ALTE|nr:hypothetical protein [Paraglaciecola sp. G1-23]MCF2948561.1 hypothetical protein [Paraglaciecola sp. G1-23]